jgi:hypothetical protein
LRNRWKVNNICSVFTVNFGAKGFRGRSIAGHFLQYCRWACW